MDGYQSDSGNTSSFRNKGFLEVFENLPFPPGVKNDVWIINGVGSVGALFLVNHHDVLLCVNDNPGGNSIENAWIVLPRRESIIVEP